ncbi:MAG: cytochrome c family protein [Hyphomicrobiaceae bacterium]
MKSLASIAILSVALFGFAGTVQAQGDPEEGENVFKKCRTCHDVGDSAKNKVGPALNNIVGRKAASVKGFAYSTDMKALGSNGFVWSEENLSKYLENVKSVVANGKMVFPGLKDEQDRKDLIAYLKKFTK